MKVFVTGATGYIGFNVATAFRRAGHEVWGLARSQEKASKRRPVSGRPEAPFVPRETRKAAAGSGSDAGTWA